jgi:hypothetical protein
MLQFGEPANPSFIFDLCGGIPTNGTVRCPRNFEQIFRGLALSGEQSSGCALFENSQKL